MANWLYGVPARVKCGGHKSSKMSDKIHDLNDFMCLRGRSESVRQDRSDVDQEVAGEL